VLSVLKTIEWHSQDDIEKTYITLLFVVCLLRGDRESQASLKKAQLYCALEMARERVLMEYVEESCYSHMNHPMRSMGDQVGR
jgi:hypothetical protein